ncbi:sigma-70 family RNA polymerase sigma factor [Streptomyces sp. NPDC052287]|uniref:RNA polymerase sigma factor n=1 Tax=Streptomyces sp. NPDC052287 TaxID=3154950 RepID=UPI00344878CD
MTDLRADFCNFCDEYAIMLFRTVNRYSRNTWDAEDAVQETLLNFWSRWDNEEFRQRVRKPGFAVTSAINSWRDNVRSEISRAKREENDGRKVVASQDDYSRVDGDLDFSRMLKILGSLNPTWRTVIIMRYEQEYTLAEVAAALGVSEATARRYEKRAIMALKEGDKRI